jgi:ABC-2 type transport system ATP-binding protein
MDSKPATESVVSIKGLRMSFGDFEALKGIDLEVGRGEVVGYIGPNGAGKSTTVKILLGIQTGFEGEVRVLGEDIRAENPAYKRRVGYVPETPDLYDSLTAQEYISFIGQLYGLSAAEASHRGFELMDLLEVGYVYDSRISSFSKGMKQKLLISAALVHDPDVLFLDEPMSGLDANSILVFKEILSELAKAGKTVFYSSHMMDVVEKVSSRIILIAEGRVLGDGSFEELKAQSHQASLEGVFGELTGFEGQEKIARSFVGVMRGEEP